jgi:glucose/arabinose dehydrogenase
MIRRAIIASVALACRGNTVAGQDQALHVPAGFQVAVFAQDLGGVRYLALGPRGVVYASRPGAGDIVKLPDANGDGVADSVVTVASGLNQPFGIAFRGDTMYVAENRAVVRFDPGSATKVVVVPNVPGGRGHSTRTIAFGADGRMYVSVGSSCNICDEADSMRAAVTQFNRDGSGGRVFARGLRNSVGLAFNPATGALWATNNDRDNLGDDAPPDRINIVQDGKYYGWPQCYLPGQRNPEYAAADCSTVEPPAITFQAHSAPMGLAFYTGTAFPADYRGDAFVAYHGSWNRSVPTGAKVVRVQVVNGRPAGVDDFVTGWQRADGSRWGRPVGLVVAADGALLVSDDMGGKIWRVTYGR